MSDSKTIRFFSFSTFHNKNPVAGSTFIRVNQLIKYWEGADLYTYGENPDVLIFQKVYCTPDYKFPAHFPGIKILDICDPDWFSPISIKETVDAMDAVVCPTEAIAKFIRQMTDKPVKVIKDRFDLEVIPEPKKHEGLAKTAVWFGYSHNAELLRPALPLFEKYKIKLLLISDHDPLVPRWGNSPAVREYLEQNYKFVKHETETIYQELQKADFAVLPKGSRPEDAFKSENKTIRANLAGLPVAYDLETWESVMSAEARNYFVRNNLPKIRKEYDVRKSVEEYKELISCLPKTSFRKTKS